MEEKIASGEIVFANAGTRLVRKTYLKNQKGLAPSSLWDNIEETGHNRQAKYELKKLFPEMPTSELFATPKPEKVIQRILTISTDPGDWVLDSFAGSGTTGAVAHKMGRRWVMVELGEHCHDVIIPRLKKVIGGADGGGITEAVGWKGGGGFRYYIVAPSLLNKDQFGNWVITKKFNPAMLAEAVCKLEGFKYAPSDTVYWQHGHSTETDFIYVTTQTLTREQLQQISDEVGDKQSLLVCCGAFRVKADTFPNLTLKKIPKAVLHKCEWGHDDYSLEIKNLPAAPAAPDTLPLTMEPDTPAGRSAARRRQAAPSLFETGDGQ